MATNKVTHLDVFIGGAHAGLITLLPQETTIFSFAEEYIEDLARPMLSLSYIDTYGNLITDRNSTNVQLEPFFSNLLPEGKLRDYLAESAGVKTVREFYLMWILGRDLSGNVIIKPSDGEDWPPLEDKSTNKEEIRKKREKAMRFSLAGVQLKFSALQSDNKGLTIPATGKGGDWIVKLPSERFKGVPENEYSMMSLAKTVGIDVPDVRLMDMEEIDGMPDGIGDISGQAFVIKRFDRLKSGKRVHIEDFAQVFNIYPDRKYERGNYKNIAEVLWIKAGDGAIEEFVRRIVFNALIGNSDMHMKNWSLIYRDGITPDIAPAYDFLSTIPYIKDEGMALNLFRGGPKLYEDLTLENFKKFAAKAKLPETLVTQTVTATVEAFQDNWEEAKKSLPIRKALSVTIEKHIKAIPLSST